MGLRFRRSVKIMPGVRLNFSARGMSTTIGPRGASINVGSRGTFMNLGLPGTGLSYRSRLTSGDRDSPDLSSEPLYLSPRAASRAERQRQRETLRELAQDLHAEREAHLTALRNILHNRSRDLIDWLEEYGSAGPYQPRPFVPPLASVSTDQVREEVWTANPLQPWIATTLAALVCAALAPQLWVRVPALVIAGYFGFESIRLWQQRPVTAAGLVASREAEQARLAEEARIQHENEEALRASRHQQEEALRTRIRDAVVSEDAAILSSVLEVELSNEELPLPLDFEIEFEGIRRVRLEVEMPTMDAIPPTLSSVTKTGKFSERKMAQRDRLDLYKDVCAGLALRLVHEVFRVLPFVEHVTLLGIVSGPDPSTGQQCRVMGLRLTTDRAPFLTLSLDNVDPSLALSQLGGEMKTTRDGKLQPLETVHGE
jgi:hypothetical protein